MKIQFIKESINYDGSQLKPLTNYLKHGLLGTSVVGWIGPCRVATEHMIDGEDLRAQEVIASDSMVHFVFEIFDMDLKGSVVLQRLMAEVVKVYIQKNSKSASALKLVRRGDDLFCEDKKLNISIATKSSNSCLVHFAVNVVSTGAPVPVLSLNDLDIKADVFCKDILLQMQSELIDIFEASQKVRVF